MTHHKQDEGSALAIALDRFGQAVRDMTELQLKTKGISTELEQAGLHAELCRKDVEALFTVQTTPPQANDKELEAISKEMGWWAGPSVMPPNGGDAFPEKTAKVMALIHKDRAAVREKTIMDFNSRIAAAQELASHQKEKEAPAPAISALQYRHGSDDRKTKGV